MRLGAPVFVKTADAVELAKAHRDLGYGAAYCPGMAINAKSDVEIEAVRKAFEQEDIVIAEVGAWGNMMSPIPEKREAHIQLVISRLAVAEKVGARCCVDYAGSASPDHPAGPHPHDLTREAFDDLVQVTRRIIDAVKPTRTAFTIEMMQWMWPDSADSYLDLIKAVDRKAFAVHFDPTNLINCPSRYFDTGAVIRECIAKLGPHIKSAHAKDCLMEPKAIVHISEVMPGKGVLDYRAFLTGLAALPQDVPLMVEHLKTPEEYAQAVAHIRGVAKECGVSL
ncbi:MAG: sugar phosphate isomerase/epimerase [Planctomycetes bacterium]|nr:sugar phosphate isomerase/epimerase [Planctomycetota bacterium]